LIDYCESIENGWVMIAQGKILGSITKGEGFLPAVYDHADAFETQRLLQFECVAIPVLAVLVEKFDESCCGNSFVFYSQAPYERVECVDVRLESKWVDGVLEDGCIDAVWAYPKLYGGPYDFDKFYAMEEYLEENPRPE